MIDLTKVSAAIPRLLELVGEAASAAEDLGIELSAVSAASGIDKIALKGYLMALYRGKLDEHRERAEQLQLLFDEVKQ